MENYKPDKDVTIFYVLVASFPGGVMKAQHIPKKQKIRFKKDGYKKEK